MSSPTYCLYNTCAIDPFSYRHIYYISRIIDLFSYQVILITQSCSFTLSSHFVISLPLVQTPGPIFRFLLSIMATSSENIQPTHYGGWEQDINQPRGGLLDKSFSSRCPPAVTTDTTIIAVCGPNDFQGNANPLKDGWYFSDFYLFHHLFRDTAVRQYWMTCVKPQDLVHQYKEFAHGDPATGDRRIVLDKTLAQNVQDSSFIRMICSNNSSLMSIMSAKMREELSIQF